MYRIKHSKAFSISQSVERLFPLFSPEGEKSWVPGWDYKNIMGSSDLHEDYIFLTENHDHGTTDAIWLVKRYEPDLHAVQFYKIEPEDKVGIVTVKCFGNGPQHTIVEVSYEYIALSKKGCRFIESFTNKVYDIYISEWEDLLIDYFSS